MSPLTKFFAWLEEIGKHTCPNCKTELDCYGSEPWGIFRYMCDKCGFKENNFNDIK